MSRLLNACRMLRKIQRHRLTLEGLCIMLTPGFIGRNVRCLILVVETVHRPSFVAMQPGAVATERYEID